jgi:DNA-binding CsgD family transcriptional regulator
MARIEPDSESIEHLRWARSEVAWSAGRLQDCIVDAEAIATDAAPLTFGKPAAAALLHWCLWELQGSCEGAVGPLAVFAAQRGMVDETQAVDLLCLPGRERDAATTFLKAAELHDHYLRRNALRCRWGAGEALRRAGDVEAAEALLRDVGSACARHGFLPLGRRVDASLRQMGAARTPPSQRSGSLTPRELEILALVRQGLSTSEISARLHLRPSTIDSHIRKSMRRLGAANRREAALLADDER